MTEKRFRIYQDIYEVFYIKDVQHYSDNRLQKGYKIGHEEDVNYKNVSDVVDLLNELHEENMMLKGEVAHYKLILMSLEKEAKRLSQIR